LTSLTFSIHSLLGFSCTLPLPHAAQGIHNTSPVAFSIPPHIPIVGFLGGAANT
jgi:hypothetical protein